MARAIAATLALLLLATSAVPALASQDRKIEGRFSGAPTLADQRCPGALTIGHEISGVASVLGRFAGSGTNCTEFTFATERVDIWDGVVVVEAADGSTLTLSAEGVQEAPVNGVAAYSHVDTVVAGTGRFTGAEGVLTVSGQIDFTTLVVTGTVSGWIRY